MDKFIKDFNEIKTISFNSINDFWTFWFNSHLARWILCFIFLVHTFMSDTIDNIFDKFVSIFAG